MGTWITFLRFGYENNSCKYAHKSIRIFTHFMEQQSKNKKTSVYVHDSVRKMAYSGSALLMML